MESENSSREITPSQNQQYRRRLWCFTLFTRDGVQCIPPTELPDTMTYLQFQEEVCPETKRHHYQGFIRTAATQGNRMLQVKSHLQTAFRTTLSPRVS